MFTLFGRLVIGMVLVIGISGTMTATGQELPSLRELERAERPEIPGAKVANGNDAARISQKAYVEKMHGLSAYEGAGGGSIIELGFEVKGFAKLGDKVWEIRFTSMNPAGRRALRAILWVHSETGQVHFVCGPWETTDPSLNKETKGVPLYK